MPEPAKPLALASRTLWIGNVEAWMDEAYLAQTFMHIGRIANLKVVRDCSRKSPTGFAFMELSSQEEALTLLERLNGEPFIGVDGHRFRVSWATHGIGEHRGAESFQASLYVGNLDFSIADVHLFKAFAKRFDSVAAAKVIVDPVTGNSRGYGFVRFTEPEHIEVALAQMQGLMVGAKPIRLRKAQALTPRAGAPLTTSGPSGGAGGPWSTGSHAPHQTPAPFVPPAKLYGVVIPGTYPNHSELELCTYFSIFGVVTRIAVSWEHESTQVDFQYQDSATNCAEYIFEQAGLVATLVETEDGRTTVSPASLAPAAAALQWAAASQMQGAPVITNATMSEASSHLHAHVAAYLKKLPQPSTQHFEVLLQDPLFVRAFEEQLARRRAEEESDDRMPRMSWLLQDGPELFSDSADVAMMNVDFLRSVACARSACRAPPALRGERLRV